MAYRGIGTEGMEEPGIREPSETFQMKRTSGLGGVPAGAPTQSGQSGVLNRTAEGTDWV
jgi:hypothetical protein